MPTSNSTYDKNTTAQTVVAEYADHVKDKTILITGANPGGIGGTTATALAAANPKMIIVSGRSASKLDETTKEINKINTNVTVKQLILDLSSQDSCRKAAQQILDDAEVSQIDLLINNAGVMDIAERTLSPEGIEMQFATNHVGHYLFTNLILPKIVLAAKNTTSGATRIINLSSRAVVYGPVRFSDWNFTKREADLPEAEHMSKEVRAMWDEKEDLPYVPQAAYGQSKCANVLFTRELNKRLLDKNGVLSVAVHPGGVSTNLARHIDEDKFNEVITKFKDFAGPKFHMKNLEEGSSTTLVAALDPKITKDDFFMEDCQFADWAPDAAKNEDLADKLWSLSEGLVRQQFLN